MSKILNLMRFLLTSMSINFMHVSLNEMKMDEGKISLNSKN